MNMRAKNKRRLLSIVILICLFATGCEQVASLPGMVKEDIVEEKQAVTKEAEFLSFGLEPHFDYQVPVMKAAVKVDQVGYLPNQAKVAVFEGAELAEQFEVINLKTKKCDYLGKIESRGNNSFYGIEYGYGDFSDFAEEGIYYIRTERIGCSYPFAIGEKVYEELFPISMKQFYYSRCGTSLTEEYAGEDARNACHTSLARLQEDMKVELDVSGGWHVDEKGNRSVITGCNAMQQLLLAYELNSEAFQDGQNIPESEDGIPDLLNELQYEASWLLKMQDPATGGVYDGIRTTDYGNGSSYSYVQAATVEASLRFAAAMAKFSYLFQNYDTLFATTCLKAADKAYRFADHYPDETDENMAFRAAAELYRATGYQVYRSRVEGLLYALTNLDMTDDALFGGCVTYLFTKQRVDTNLCDRIIKELMKYVEVLSYDNRSAAYLAGRQAEQGILSMLQDASRMAVVNYVITNNEYDKILENYIHFFLGCNLDAVCYVGRFGDYNAVEVEGAVSIMNQPESDAYWILLMSSVYKNLMEV